jgi:hypothetical protein
VRVLVKFTEVISDNHQGGSGKIFDRQTIMYVDGAIMADRIYAFVLERLKDHSPVTYDVNDKQLIRLNSVEIFE